MDEDNHAMSDHQPAASTSAHRLDDDGPRPTTHKRPREDEVDDGIYGDQEIDGEVRKRQATSPQQSTHLEQDPDQALALPTDGDRIMGVDEDVDDEEEELEVFDDPSHVPRIGRWIVPRPPPDAKAPLYAIPIEAPDDPEDQPIMEDEAVKMTAEQEEARLEQEALTDIPQEAASIEMVNQEAVTILEEPAPVQEPVLPSIEPAATSTVAALPPALGCAITWPALADLDHATAVDQLCRQVTSSPVVPAFLRGELTRLLIQGSVPLSNSASDEFDATAFPWLSSRKLWMFSYTSSVDKRGQSPVIVCKPQSHSFDVLPAPARLAAQLAGSKFTQSPWIDAETGRPYRDDGTVTDPPEPVAPMPETIAVAKLQESNLALQQQVADLVAEKKKITSRLMSAQAGETSAIENAQMCRTLYDQASQKARQAIAETTEHQERAEKLERQVTEGLAAHRERFRVAQASWKEMERQLRDQIKLLSQSQERAQSAEVLQSVAEWRVWMAGEENRRKKRLREEREKRELLERQMTLEIEEEELEALREEAEAADREAAGESSQSQGPFALGSSQLVETDDGLANPQAQFEATAQLDEIQRREARQYLQAAREAENLEAQQEAAKNPYDRMADGLLDTTDIAGPSASSRRSAVNAATMTESQRRQAEEDAAMAALANERELTRKGEDVAAELSMWESSIRRENGTSEEAYPSSSADFTAGLFEATSGSDNQAAGSAAGSGLEAVNGTDLPPLAVGEAVDVAEWLTDDQESDVPRRVVIVNGDGLPRIMTNGDAS